MSEKKFVTYEEFGAVGDGVTNDFAALLKTHEYANENGLKVLGTKGKVYYISDTRIDGEVKSIKVKTDVDWCGAEFIIDESPYSTHENYGMYVASIFEILSDYPMVRIEDAALFEKLLAAGFDRKTKKIDLGLDYPALIIPYNTVHRIYRRRGYGQWAGEPMHEVILLDKDGNVDPETPVMWDYNAIDHIDVIRTDIKPITIENAKFTNIACNVSCVVFDENGKPKGVREPYIARGLFVNRSYTTIKNVEHYMKGEISIERQKKGEIGAPYRGFFRSENATHVTFDSCVMTGKRCYQKAWIGEGFSGTMGTYDLSGMAVNKIVFKNCTQSNFWVTIDENSEIHPAKEGDPGAVPGLSPISNGKGQTSRMHWGVGGTNYCKNMEYIGCYLTRYDAHQGLCNGKVIDSTLVCLALTGSGTMTIENSRVFAEDHVTNMMFCMRSDYGAIWDGDVNIKGVKAYMYTKKWDSPNAPLKDFNGIGLVSHTYSNWYFGYDCSFPNISIDDVEFYDIETFEPIPKGSEIKFAMGNMLTEPALYCENTLNTPSVFPDVDKDGDGLVDGTNIPYDDVVNRFGIVDESSRKNLNPIRPPKYARVLNNKNNYVYLVNDMSSFEGITDGGFFKDTEFITDDETYVGTQHIGENTKTFKFVKP